MNDFLKDGPIQIKQDPIKKNMLGDIIEIAEIPVHPSANIVPFTDDIARLSSSIERSGLRLAVTLYKGEIIDGRRRVTACHYAGVAPRFDEIYKDKDLSEKELYELVLDLNNRRDLTPSQKALIAAAECKKGKHKLLGYSRATNYSKEIWGISPSLHDSATWLWEHFSGYAQAMFDNGVVEVDKKRFKSVVGLKKLLSQEPDKYDDGDIDVARAKDIFMSAWNIALKNISRENILKGESLAKEEYMKKTKSVGSE